MTSQSNCTPEEIRESREFKKWTTYAYGTHAKAAKHFRSQGLSGIDVVPRYGPEDVRAHLQKIMDQHAPGVKVMNLTTCVPTAPSGSLLDCIKTLYRAREAAAKNPNVLWYVQRTRENTPALVHMLAYGDQVSNLGKSPDGALSSDASISTAMAAPAAAMATATSVAVGIRWPA